MATIDLGDLVDSHVHLWNPLTTPRDASRGARLYKLWPWGFEQVFKWVVPSPDREFIQTPRYVGRPFMPHEYRVATTPVSGEYTYRVRSVVHVEATWTGPCVVDETKWLTSLDYGPYDLELTGIVAQLDPSRPDAVSVLDEHLAAAPGQIKGIRCSAAHHPDPGVKNWSIEGLYRSADFLRGFAEIADRGLSFDAWVYSHQLGDVAVLAREYPDSPIMLDHYGTPVGLVGPVGRDVGVTQDARRAISAAWWDGLAELASLPNVYFKQSGLFMPILGFKGPVSRDFGVDTIGPHIQAGVDTFGIDRMVFGSNSPMDLPVFAVGDQIAVLASTLGDDPNVLQKVFRDNGTRFYRL